MKILRNALLVLVLVVGGLYAFGPREPIDLTVRFDTTSIGSDLDDYLAVQEAQFDDIRPDNQKQIIWAGAVGVKTDLAIIYAHGFSASSGEIRPLPEQVAAAANANLYYMRLAGHGRTEQAMGQPTMSHWIQDMAEAMAIARRLGKRVLVISTSTGGTLAVLAASNPEMNKGLAGMVLISPNFEPHHWAAKLARWPLARLWVPMLTGEWKKGRAANALQEQYWTKTYPIVAGLPMMALVTAANALDFSAIKTPALFIYSKADQVVKSARTEQVIPLWGGPKQVELRVMTDRDGKTAHVIAGDAVSPAQTQETVQIISKWVAALK